jgi:hypothetical protein
MTALAVAALLASGQLRGLGHPDYRHREAAERRLRADGVTGFVAAVCGTAHPDPEVRARCRRVVEDSDARLTLQHAAVVEWVLLCESGRDYVEERYDWESGAEHVTFWYVTNHELPTDVAEWLNEYADRHPATFRPVLDAALRRLGCRAWLGSSVGFATNQLRAKLRPNTPAAYQVDENGDRIKK